MAVRTIGVSVTGKGELEKVAKLVSSIKSNLASLEKELAGLEGPAVSLRVGLASKGIIGETTTLAKMLSNHKDTGVKLRVSLKSKGLIKQARDLKTALQNELDGVSVKIEGKKNNTSTGSSNSSTKSSSNKKSSTKTSSGSGGGNRLSSDEIKERNELALQKKAQEAQIQVNKAREIAQIKAEADAQKRIAKVQEDDRKARVKQQQERERAERQAQRDAERRASKEEKDRLVADARERKQREIDNLPNTYRRIINDRVGRDKKEAIETYFSYMDEVSKAVRAKYSEGSISTREAILNNNPIIVSQLLAKHYDDKLNLDHSKHRKVESKGLLMDENDKYAGVPLAFDGTILHGTRALTKELAKLDDALESFGAPEEVRRAAKEVYEIIGITTDKVEELNDRFLESMKALETIGQLADSLNQKLLAFTGTSLDKGFVLPLRTLTGIYTQSARQMASMSLNTGRSIGQNIYQGFRSGFSSILVYARQTLGAMVQDARELSDAMTNYRNNMSVLGLSNNEINRNIKDLGDYGRKSVYDASDLLNMSSNYIALGFSSEIASQMTKAMAGLVANRDDSHLGIARATKQLEQILVKGKASTEDLNTMRQWFNAIGVKRFNDGLKAIADEAGYGENIAKATKEGALTAEKIQELIIKVGTAEDIQALVTKIATPGQAVANLRETLANLLAYDRITENPDGAFSRADAPLSKLYRSTTQFIKGISELLGSQGFERYLTLAGNSVSELIDDTIRLGSAIRRYVGGSFVTNMEKVLPNLSKGFQGLRTHNNLINFVSTLSSSLTEIGNSSITSKFLSDLVNNIIGLASVGARFGSTAINNGALNFLTDWVKFYEQVGNLALSSGATSLIDDVLGFVPSVAGTLLKDKTVAPKLRGIVSQLGKAFTELGKTVSHIGVSGGGVSGVLSVVSELVKFISTMFTNIRTRVGSYQIRSFVDNLVTNIKYLLDNLAIIYTELLSSAITAGASQSGKRFFRALADFIIEVNQALVNAFRRFGGGSTTRGMQNILDFFTTLVDLATKLVNILGRFPETAVALFALTKAIGFITSLGQGTLALKEALGVFGLLKGGSAIAGGGGVASSKGILSKLFGRGSSKVAGEAAEAGVTSVLNRSYRELFDSGFGRIKTKFINEAGEFALPSFASLLGRAKGLAGNTKGFVGKITKSFGSVKGDLLAIGADMGANIVDGLVQSSNMSDGAKKVSSFFRGLINVGVSTWTGASTGTFAGSFLPGLGNVAGGIVGGVLGFGKGITDLLNRKEVEASEKRQAKSLADRLAKEQRDEENALVMEHMRQSYEGLSGLMRDFYSSASVGSETFEGLATSANLLSQFISNYGELASGGTLGLEDQSDMANLVDSGFINIDGQVIKLSELRDSLGLSNEQLIQSLQIMYGEASKLSFEVTDEAGNVISTVKTYSDKYLADYNKRVAEFKSELGKLGLGEDSYGNLIAKDVTTLVSDINDTLMNGDNNVFATQEEYKEALLSAISQGRENIYTSLKDKTVWELEEIAKAISGSASEINKTNQEKYADIIEKITKFTDMTVEEAMDRAGKTLEDAQKLLETEMFNHLGSRKDTLLSGAQSNLDKAQEVANSLSTGGGVEGHLEDSKEDIEKFVGMINSGDVQEKFKGHTGLLARLRKIFGDIDDTLLLSIMDKITSGEHSFREVLDLVKAEAQAGVDKAKKELQVRGAQYFQEVLAKVNEGSLTIDQAKELLQGVDISSADTTNLGENAQKLKGAVEKEIKDAETVLREASEALAQRTITYVSGYDLLGLANGLKRAVEHNIAAAKTSLTNALNQLSVPLNSHNAHVMSQTLGLWEGGEVQYRASGGTIFKSRATDTVPAMLTPGEFVIRKKAVESVGVNFLRNLNANGNKALHNTSNRSIIYNVYNNNNARVNQNIDNKSQYLNGMQGLDRLMRYV